MIYILINTKGIKIMSEKAKTVQIKGKHYLVLKDEIKNMQKLGFSEKNAKETVEQLESVGLAEIIEIKGKKYIRILDPK